MCRRHSRKKVVATASRRECGYKRTGEPSVPFYEKGGTAKQVTDFFHKKNRNKRNLFRRGACDGTRTCDLRITNALHYQLCYTSIFNFKKYTILNPFCQDFINLNTFVTKRGIIYL